MKSTTAIVAVILAFLVGIVVYAQTTGTWIHRHDTHGPSMGFGHGFLMMQGLKPTEAQMDQIRKIALGTGNATLPIKLEEEKQKIELAQILLQPNADRAKISSKLQEILDLEKKKQEQMVDAYFQIMKILNPEQQAVFTRMVVTRITDMGHGGDDMMMRRGPGPDGMEEPLPGK